MLDVAVGEEDDDAGKGGSVDENVEVAGVEVDSTRCRSKVYDFALGWLEDMDEKVSLIISVVVLVKGLSDNAQHTLIWSRSRC